MASVDPWDSRLFQPCCEWLVLLTHTAFFCGGFQLPTGGLFREAIEYIVQDNMPPKTHGGDVRRISRTSSFRSVHALTTVEPATPQSRRYVETLERCQRACGAYLSGGNQHRTSLLSWHSGCFPGDVPRSLRRRTL